MTCIGCSKIVSCYRSLCDNEFCYQLYLTQPVDNILCSAMRDKSVLNLLLDINIAAGKQPKRSIQLFDKLPNNVNIDQIVENLSLFKRKMSSLTHIIDEKQLYDTIGKLQYTCLRYILFNRFLLSSFNIKLGDSSITRYDIQHDSLLEDQFTGNIMYLWHGSPIHNWGAILRNGLKPTNKELMTSGAVYGNGIYMAKDLTTSYNYSRSRSDHVIVALCELSVECDKYKMSNGWCHVIPDSSMILIRSLIMLDNNIKLNDIDVALKESYMNRNNKRKIVRQKISNRFEKRIENEIQILRSRFMKSYYGAGAHIGDKLLRLYMPNYIIIVYMRDYPLNAPIVTLMGPKLLNDRINQTGVYLYDALGDWSATIKLPTIIDTLMNNIANVKYVDGHYDGNVENIKSSIRNIVEFI